MNRHTLLSLALLLLAATAARADTEEFNLVVGGQRAFPAEGIQNYSVSDQKMLQVAVSEDGRKLVAKALKPGTATLVLIHENKAEPDRTITFNISLRDPVAVMRELNDILRNYPGVVVKQAGPKIVIQGAVQTAQEEQKLKELERSYGGQVVVTVTVGPTGARRAVMVRLDLHYVRMDKQIGRRFGIGYPASIGRTGQQASFRYNYFDQEYRDRVLRPMQGSMIQGQLLPPTVEAYYSIVQNLLPWLDIGENYGYSRILRTDTIVTENGQAAVYKDGAEYTIAIQPQVAGTSPTVKQIFVGAELTLTPQLSPNNDAVSLDVKAELSQFSSPPQGSVIVFVRPLDRIETNVHLPVGQSVMLSGVKLKSNARNSSGIPWLNRIPILGYLFGSESYDRQDAFSVVYVTPTLIQATSQENRRRIDEALKQFESQFYVP